MALCTAAPELAAADGARFAIAAQPMPSALTTFAVQSHMQLLYRYDEVAGVRSNPLNGTFEKREALRRLLLGTGLEATYASDTAATIRPLRSIARRDIQAGASGRQSIPAAPSFAPVAADTARAPDSLSEIIVTATKRAESIERVPATITAIRAAMLDVEGIESTRDLQFHTPSLVISSNVQFDQPYIRGIGSDLLTIGEDSNVATYIDGIYVSRPVAMFQQLLDVERVEILKGPQGTLYGRNATGGVINIVSEDPSDQLTEKALLSYGSHHSLRLGATLSGPLAQGVAGLISVLSADQDGYVTDTHTGGRLESESDLAGRAALKITRGDATVTLGGDVSRERDTRGQGFHVEAPGAGSLGGVLPSDPLENSADYPPRTVVGGAGLRAQVDLVLGRYHLVSLSGYRESDFDVDIDLDDSSRPFATIAPEREHADSLTEEVRVNAQPTRRLSLVGGLYLLRENSHALYDITVSPASIHTAPQGENTTQAYAAFGQADVQITRGLKLSVGGRESDETKSVSAISTHPAPALVSAGRKSWNAFTPYLGLELTLPQSVFLYATASEGFKSGGFDALTRGAPEFDPEFVWAYEAGVKSSLLERRLVVNLSGFYYDYTDMQVTRNSPAGIVSTVVNAAKSSIRGLEGELQARLPRGLSVDLGVSWLDARFERYMTVNPNTDPNVVLDLAGNTLPRAPPVQTVLGVQYETRVRGALALSFRADGQYRGETYFDAFDSPQLREGGFCTLNLSLALARDIGSWKWTVQVYGKNVTDKTYATNAAQSNGFYGVVKWYDPPATVGITLRAAR